MARDFKEEYKKARRLSEKFVQAVNEMYHAHEALSDGHRKRVLGIARLEDENALLNQMVTCWQECDPNWEREWSVYRLKHEQEKEGGNGD